MYSLILIGSTHVLSMDDMPEQLLLALLQDDQPRTACLLANLQLKVVHDKYGVIESWRTYTEKINDHQKLSHKKEINLVMNNYLKYQRRDLHFNWHYLNKRINREIIKKNKKKNPRPVEAHLGNKFQMIYEHSKLISVEK